MFGLLKAAWQHESVDKRLRAIEKMDALNAANQTILFELASFDIDNTVRQHAINKLTDPSALYKLSQTHENTETRTHAELVLHQIIGTKSQFTETDFRQLITQHTELTRTIAMVCPHANLRQEIAQTLSPSEQASIIAKVEYTNTRQWIAQQLTDIEALEQARASLKGKDKNAEKIIKTKLQEHHAAQQQQQENFDQAFVICEKMEYIANHRSHPDFQAMFKVWSQRWQALTFTADETLNIRYQTAFEHAQKAISAQEKLHALIANQQLLLDDLKEYCQKIATLSWHALCEESSTIDDTIEQSDTIWTELIAASPMESTQLHDQFMQMQNALSSLTLLCDTELEHAENTSLQALEKAIRAVNWPNNYPALKALTEATNQRDELKTIAKLSEQEYTTKVDQLHKRMNRLLGSTQRGNLGQAKRELAAITKAVASTNGKDKTILEERLHKANEAVGKMGDWKDFATEPKFLTLCDSMEKLIDTKLHPDALAAKISELQKKWKALGYADCADEHWERFKTAADKAYEPCALFFAERHKTREQNLEKREPLVKQMQQLSENTDWDSVTDYKPIESKLNNIIHAWRKIKDVERDAGQAQWDRLCVFKASIYEQLDVIYDENIESKNQLIEQTKTLLDADVSNETLNKLKLFQSRWKQIGITRRKQDKEAWQTFKSVADDVYEKIQDTRKTQRAEEDVHLEGYREVIKKIRQLGKNQMKLHEADKHFEQFKEDYQALPPLPKKLAEKLAERLDNDFKKACDTYNATRIDLQAAEYQHALAALNQKARLCTELEKNNATKEKERLTDELNAIEINNNELKQRFEKRLETVSQTDRTAANQARQRLCLDLEILLDVESPAEEKAHRIQVQLERMKGKGLGHAVKDINTALEDFKLDWLCLPGADPELQASLEKRFQQALNASTINS